MVKETFIIRTEWWDAISCLKEKEKAVILNNLFQFHLGENDKIILNTPSLILVWKLIEPNLKRNVEAYDRRCETSAENGKKGGRPPKENKPKKPIETYPKPIETLSDTDSDSVTDSDSENESDEAAKNRAQISSTHLNEFQKISIDDCRKKYDAENVDKRNQIGFNLKINPDEVIILHNAFDSYLKTIENEKAFNDYTRHFSNWANSLPPDELKQKIKTTQAVFMRPEQIKTDSSKYEDYYWNPNLKKA